MKKARAVNKARKKGCRQAHQAFDGRGRHGEQAYRRRHLPKLGSIFDWWNVDRTEKKGSK